MKRREFLRSAVGLTGTLVPALAVAGKVPCPPESLSVASGSAARGACGAAADSGGVPQWVQDLPVNSGWQHVAGGTDWPGLQPWQRGARMADVRMQPIPYAKGFAGMDDIIQSWQGGSMDTDRREFLIVANGGHSSYLGNEGYALQLWRDVPAWKRLSDSTPNDELLFDIDHRRPFELTDVCAVHADGRPRSFHSSGNVQYANGRVWTTMQTSVTPGGSAQGIWSWDRAGIAALPGDFAPWQKEDPFPYRIHGIAGLKGDPLSFAFGSSAYDPVTGYVWGYSRQHAWAIDTHTGKVAIPPTPHGYNWGSSGYKGAWAVCLPDRRQVMIGLARTNGQIVYVHDLKRPVSAFAFRAVSTAPEMQWDPDSYWFNWSAPGTRNDGCGGGTNEAYVLTSNPFMRNAFAYGMGAAYVAGKVYVGPVPSRLSGTLGGEVRVLDPETMKWDELVNTGVRSVANAGSKMGRGTQWGNFQRFNVVQFGSATVLLHVADWSGPVQAWRIS
jgi:hypothetical protein